MLREHAALASVGGTLLALVCSLLLAVVVSPVLIPGQVWAYDRWSVAEDATNCRFCHGDFRNSQYTSLADGENWGSLHNLHRFDMLGGNCGACHRPDTTSAPVYTNRSEGAAGLPTFTMGENMGLSYGCSGCHGRSQDGSTPMANADGWGAGLRQHHHRSNVGVDNLGLACVNCHTDADPDNFTPVGEDTLPPFYASPGTIATIPDDSCNPGGSEDFAGLATGLDNDGDLAYDGSDSDCSAPSATPGETSGAALAMLLVTSHDPGNTMMGISYESGCEATNNTIEFGPLSEVAKTDPDAGAEPYTGQQCNIGTDGSYLWDYSGTPDSMFFMVVGRHDTAEGSYGINSAAEERVEDTTNMSCSIAQDLANRCD